MGPPSKSLALVFRTSGLRRSSTEPEKLAIVEQVNQRDRYRNLAQPAPETLVGPALFVSSSKTPFRHAMSKATLTRYFSGVPVDSVTAFILQTPIQPMDLN